MGRQEQESGLEHGIYARSQTHFLGGMELPLAARLCAASKGGAELSRPIGVVAAALPGVSLRCCRVAAAPMPMDATQANWPACSSVS